MTTVRRTTRAALVGLLAFAGCQTKGEAPAAEGGRRTPSGQVRSQPATVTERGGTATTVSLGDGVKRDKIRIADPDGRYLIELRAGEFEQLTDPAAIKEVHPEAVVAWKGPDKCRGALLMRPGVIKRYAELKPTAERRLAELPVEKPEVLWFEPKRYNARPGYRWSAKGVSRKDGRMLRYRYTIGDREGWVFEVIARSPSHFSVARWCHDAVTAAVTF